MLILAISFIGCDKDKDGTAESITEGVYVGTFQRLTSTGGNIVEVTLNLNNGAFDGSVEAGSYRYPVIGRGHYSLSNGNITFVDTLSYPADFEWTLILKDEYKYTAFTDSLFITREYANGVKDIYQFGKPRQ